jgi:alanine racemase
MRPNWAEISRAALAGNVRTFRRRLRAAGGAAPMLCAVVKANAYGHGLIECAQVCRAAGADWLAVTDTAEAVALRRAGIGGRILVLGDFDGDEAGEMVRHGLTPTVWTRAQVERLARAAKWRGAGQAALPIHLNVDTGMSRLGAPAGEFATVARYAARRGLAVEAAYTHLASSEGPAAGVAAQMRRFFAALSMLEPGVAAPGFFWHAANSAAAWRWPGGRRELPGAAGVGSAARRGALGHGAAPEGAGRKPKSAGAKRERTAFAPQNAGLAPEGAGMVMAPQGAGLVPQAAGMLRVGLGLYGICLAPGAEAELRPALAWKTRIVALRDVPAGTPVGYGGDRPGGWKAPRRGRIATLACGYADGYLRAISFARGAHVLVRGRRAPLAGRVSMDLMGVDVSAVPTARVGDEVVLIGAQGPARITANDVAGWAGTIAYEVTCAIAARVQRRYR